MKILRHVGSLSFEADGDTDKLQFESLAKIDAKEEVFGHTVCELCGTEAKFSVRTVEDNNYYEMVCKNRDCWGKLAFGQKKKGGELFPKRKNKNKEWLPNNGWTRYVKGQNPEDHVESD